MKHDMLFSLRIRCPFCDVTSFRESTASFVHMDAAAIQAHSSHKPGCAGEFATEPVAYEVVREPNEYRQLEGDPMPPEPEGGA